MIHCKITHLFNIGIGFSAIGVDYRCRTNIFLNHCKECYLNNNEILWIWSAFNSSKSPILQLHDDLYCIFSSSISTMIPSSKSISQRILNIWNKFVTEFELNPDIKIFEWLVSWSQMKQLMKGSLSPSTIEWRGNHFSATYDLHL